MVIHGNPWQSIVNHSPILHAFRRCFHQLISTIALNAKDPDAAQRRLGHAGPVAVAATAAGAGKSGLGDDPDGELILMVKMYTKWSCYSLLMFI